MSRLEKFEFSLKPSPPFRLDYTAWANRRRQSNNIDTFDGERYQRAVTLDDKVVEISVFDQGSRKMPRIGVEIEGERINSDDVRSATRILELLLGLKIDLSVFYEIAKHAPETSELVVRFRGLKPPRFPSIFETLVNAISCQQISLAVGLLLLNRFAQNYGRTIKRQKSTRSPLFTLHAFPLPHDLSKVRPESLRKLGFSTKKSEYIIGLARSIINKELKLEDLAHMSDDDALDYLQSIPGVGRWSSQYVLLRGSGRLHRFPADDVGAQNGLKRLLGLRKRPDYDRTVDLIEPLQPYGGVIYFHLLLSRIEREGVIFQKV